MAENRMCPHCGGQMFAATITRACVVEVTTDAENPYKILKENKDKFDVEIVKCARCKSEVSETELVVGVQCKECGRVVGPMDVNADGICNVCEAVKQRAELANASREDLIKMLLDAEKKVNPVVAKMEKQIEKAEEYTAAPAVTSVSAKIESTEETGTEETEVAEEEKPKTTRRKRRKKGDDEAEQVDDTATEVEEVAENESPEETTEAINDIANQQEAPFPDLGDAMNPPVAEAPVIEEPVIPAPMPTEQTAPVEQAIGAADFNMFDDGEEPF